MLRFKIVERICYFKVSKYIIYLRAIMVTLGQCLNHTAMSKNCFDVFLYLLHASKLFCVVIVYLALVSLYSPFDITLKII